MKKLFILFGLIYACSLFGQTEFNDLSESTSSSSTDQYTVVNSAGTVTKRITHETMFADVEDRITDTVWITGELHKPFTLGTNSTGDGSLMVTGAILNNMWYHNADTISPVQVSYICGGTSGDVTVQLYHGSNPYGTGTSIQAANHFTTAGGAEHITTFIVTKIDPPCWIWAEITAVGATAPLHVAADFIYTLY